VPEMVLSHLFFCWIQFTLFVRRKMYLIESEARVDGERVGEANCGVELNASHSGRKIYSVLHVEAYDGNRNSVLLTTNSFQTDVHSSDGSAFLGSLFDIPGVEYWLLQNSFAYGRRYDNSYYDIHIHQVYDRQYENVFEAMAEGKYDGNFYNG
jgi:hypothetical protein